MSGISRRKLITGGLVATAGIAGVAAAGPLARRYGLIPPDCRGVYGPGETLTYGAQRTDDHECERAGVSAGHDLEGAVCE